MTTPEERRQKRRNDKEREASGQPQLRRHGPDAALAKAFAIAGNPDFQSMFETLRTRYLSELEQCYLDGSPERDRAALLALNRYQALLDIKRTVFEPIQTAQRAEARQEHRQERDEMEKRPRRAPREQG